MGTGGTDGTVEWGEDRPTRWWDRLLGEADTTGRRRLSAPSLGCAVVALVLLIAAELQPWMVLNDTTGGGNAREFPIDQVGGVLLVPYYPGCMVLLALVGVGVVSRRATRRIVIAAGLGWGAGLIVVLAGLARRATSGGDILGQTVPTGFGPGLFFGFAGVVLAVVALALTGWQPGVRAKRHPASRAEPEVDGGPADLTVTPLP